MADEPLLQPIDAQNWVDQGELTWADYHAVPDARPEFYDGSADGSQSQYKTAIILIDYPDQPFLITQPAGTHPFGNPQPGWTPVAPGDVNQWMHDYYAVPNQYNGGKTLNSYWMEDSHGRIGVDVDVFGPYTMAAKSFEYGIASDFNGAVGNQANSSCPAGATCNRNIRTDGGNAWRAAIGCASGLCGYDNAFYVTAGHDESSTWQEFGEMLWTDREQVPAKFGPPGAEDGPVLNSAGNPIPNWAPTRYVPWTSWRAAANHWPNAGGGTSTQAESSGQSVFAHEFSHLRGLPDNYNNPFADNQRAGTGYWEMMSRGTFNGPGGTHNRWQVPNQGGSALGPHHMLHFKNRLGVLLPEEQVTVERNTLATQGVAVATIQARESVPGGGELAGLTVNFGTGGDAAGTCANQGLDPFYCPGTGFLSYRMEVVDRVGNDSFAPGHGVLLSKSKNSGTPSVWLIDPNPQDIGMIDFYRPDGTPVAVVRGDPRQLNDATFHAGTALWERLRVRGHVQQAPLLRARQEPGRGGRPPLHRCRAPDRRGRSVRARRGAREPVQAGRPAGLPRHVQLPAHEHGQAGAGVFDSDVYRVAATSSDAGWTVTLPNALAAAKAGETVHVPVRVLRDNKADDKSTRTTVTLTAKSETDPTKTATQTCAVHVKDTTPN